MQSAAAIGELHPHPEPRLPPDCEGCGERLGVYEPIVIPDEHRPTSWLRLRPEQKHNGLRAWHPRCFPVAWSEPLSEPDRRLTRRSGRSADSGAARVRARRGTGTEVARRRATGRTGATRHGSRHAAEPD